jgi:hypothetical protein
MPDVPVVTLLLRRKDKRIQARGLAIVDTGFDGGVYPSIEAVRVLEGLAPSFLEPLFHPLYGKIEAEAYELEGYVVGESKEMVALGSVYVYTPKEPEFLSDETLVGREILNKHKILLDGPRSILEITPRQG